METGLQQIIRTYLDTTGLSIVAFEKKADLKTNVVRNILRGQSKRPTGQTLQAIAKVMGCTVQDLLEGRTVSPTVVPDSSPQDFQILEHPEILSGVLQSILKTINENHSRVTVHQVALMLEEGYDYTLTTSPLRIDENVMRWIVKRTLN